MTLSKIEWTDRSDWNPIRGCTRVSSGCGGPGKQGGCYAEAMAARFSDPGQWGHGFAEMRNGTPRWTGKVELQEDRVALPLSWRKPARIFVSSTSDVFHEALPDEAIDKLFAVMALCPQHSFQVLTKRPERMLAYLSAARAAPVGMEAMCLTFDAYARDARSAVGSGVIITGDIPHLELWPLPNVWLGVSCEDQATADERIPLLLQTPAAVRFISAEPLLGPIDLHKMPFSSGDPHHRWDALTGQALMYGTGVDGNPDITVRVEKPMFAHLDWVIAGGESGPRARPMRPDWVRSLRDQCQAAAVPFHFKQWGAWHSDALLYTDIRGNCPPPRMKIGKKAAGRRLDGVEHNGMPT